MTPKQYLEQYKKADRETDELIDRIVVLRARAERITPKYGTDTGSGHSAVHDSLSALVAAIMEAEEKARCRMEELERMQDEIKAVIEAVPNETYRSLLSMRYIKGLPFERISCEMNYTHWYLTHHLHPKALEAVKIPPKTTKNHLEPPMKK